MKILKEASSVPWSCRYTCSGCGAELEAEEADLRPYGYRGSTDVCAFIHCITPDCGQQRGFHSKDLPLPVYNRLNARRDERPGPGPKD